MKSCYVVMRHVPNVSNGHVVTSSHVWALTENLYLAEKVIANYFTENFGKDGDRLICRLEPGFTDTREYRKEAHYNTKARDATYFTVFEEEIKDDSALL